MHKKIASTGLITCLVLIGLGLSNTTSVSAEKNDNSLITAALNSNQKNTTANKVAERTVNIENILIRVVDDNDKTATTIPYSDYDIGYENADGKIIILHEGITDGNGQIKSVNVSVPSDVTKLRIHYNLGSKERGYIILPEDGQYGLGTHLTIPDTNTISFEKDIIFRGAAPGDTGENNHQATMLNKHYSSVYNDQINAVNYARKILPSLPSTTYKPIDVIWHKGYNLDQGCYFQRNGVGVVDRPIIVIGDISKGNMDLHLKENMAHEWAHWNMYNATGMPGGAYDTDYTYNVNPQVSYKEGWATYQAERYVYKFNLKNDTRTQNDERLFGKSTNNTVADTLLDLYDIGENDESFDFSHRYLESNATDYQRDLFNEGLMYLVMIESKATTFEDFSKYVKSNFVPTNYDIANYNSALKVNGLNTNGQFTLDENGDPINP